jgi:DNA invertase Pin-like site-specific DNA recombinase
MARTPRELDADTLAKMTPLWQAADEAFRIDTTCLAQIAEAARDEKDRRQAQGQAHAVSSAL